MQFWLFLTSSLSKGHHRPVWSRSTCWRWQGRRVCLAWWPLAGSSEGRPLGCVGWGEGIVHHAEDGMPSVKSSQIFHSSRAFLSGWSCCCLVKTNSLMKRILHGFFKRIKIVTCQKAQIEAPLVFITYKLPCFCKVISRE